MPTSRSLQASFASGEFDPLLWSREDVSFFYNSARIIENAVPLPQGGVKRREGWSFRGLQRGLISLIDLSSGVLVAPNGGTAGNATDGDPSSLVTTTTGIGTTDPYAVFRIDLLAATRVSVVDVKRLRFINLPSGVTSARVNLQRSPNASSWTTVATFSVGSTAYNRRFGAKPGQTLGTDRYWRLVVSDGQNLSTATIEFSAWVMWDEELKSDGGSSVGNFSTHRLTSTIDDEYIIWATSRNADIYRANTGAWVACVDILHLDGQVADIKNSPNLDTILFYHEDVPTWFVQRLGSDEDWQSDTVAFDSVVQFPFGDEDVSGGVNEKQFIRFDSMAVNDRFLIELNGEASAEVTLTATAATNASALEAAIQGLRDVTSVSVTVDNGTDENADLVVEFDGVDGKRSWPILIVDILTGSGTATVSRTQFGTPDVDDLWSNTRGYASCGTFYQGRHWMSGFKARPDIIVASRAGDLFDFEEDIDPVSASPIVVAPNVDDQITVHNLYPGRHLQIFASSAELYVPDEPITVNNIAIKATSRHGSQKKTQPVDIQGGTLFVDRNGRALREYLFRDNEQSYSAEPVSILAGHLMASPNDLVLRRARDVDEPQLLLIANTGQDRNGVDVPAAMCVIDRAQQVTGFFRIKTEGTPQAFATSQDGEAFAVTRRTFGGKAWNYLEQFDAECMSDAGVRVSGSGSTIDLTGVAEHLDGETLFVHLDGLPMGEFTVSGNQIDLGDKSYSAEAEVGLRMVPRIVLHPYKGRGDLSPTMQRQRIFRVLLQLERTAAIAVTAADGGTPKAVSLQNHDSGVMDPPLDELLFTGTMRVSGMGQWQIEPTVEITQLSPMPFLLRSITYDVRF